MLDRLLNLKNLYALLGLESFLIISALIFITWFLYRFFLQSVSEERHKNLRGRYSNVLRHYIFFSCLFGIFLATAEAKEGSTLFRIAPYMALLAYFWGLVVFVKTSAVGILQYLFMGSMRHGVPLLVVNIGSLLLSLLLAVLSANHIFGIQVGPLVATSAALSVILGFALQDTLGNLFAGISLQIDKTFEIGDWIEVRNQGQTTIGQVKEISWRATSMAGWTDEMITIPNRILAGSQISNFFSGEHRFVRSQIFRLSYSVDVEMAKSCLLDATKGIKDILQHPEPIVMISEGTDSAIHLKLIYYISNYGSQYLIGDLILEKGIHELRREGIETVGQRIHLEGSLSK